MVNYLVSVDSETKELPDAVKDALPFNPQTIVDARVDEGSVFLVRDNESEVPLGDFTGPAGADGANVLPTATAVAEAVVAAPGATVGRTIVQRAGDDVRLDDFYVTADNGDWALTLTRALAYAAPLGRPVVLSRLYPYKTTPTYPTGSRIRGVGVGSGFTAPTNTPVRFANATGVSDVSFENFSLDGGVTPAITTKVTVRGIQFIDSSRIKLSRMFVKNVADWATSFIRCSDVSVLQHTHTGGGNGLPGGRDGIHILDCTDVLVETADIEAGDDCVGITSETVGNSRITVRNVRGKSDIGSVVILNEEGATTFPSSDINISGITTKAPTRNVVRVQAINAGTQVSRVSISNVKGESSTIQGVQVQATIGTPMVDVSVADISVIGKTHGVYLYAVKSFTASNVEGRSSTAGYDGINLSNCSYGTVNARSRSSRQWGVQVNACTLVTLQECVALDCGSDSFASSTGGGLRVVNSTDISVVGGTYAGDPATSYFGLSHSGNTRLRVTDYTTFAAANAKSARLTQANVAQIPAMIGRAKEDSAGVLTTQGVFGGTITKTAVGSYTLTPTVPFGGASPSLNVTVGHPSDSQRRRVVKKSGTASAITFQVIDDATGSPTYSEFIDFIVYDQA